MRSSIKKHYVGFVPSYVPHPLTKCAFYHCEGERTDGRYCDTHALQYVKEAEELPEDGKVIQWPSGLQE